MRGFVCIRQAVVEALVFGHEFLITKSSLQRMQTQTGEGRDKFIKSDDNNEMPNLVTAH